MPPIATAGGIVTGGIRSRATIEPSGRPGADTHLTLVDRHRRTLHSASMVSILLHANWTALACSS
jgi:hypothetical protein